MKYSDIPIRYGSKTTIGVGNHIGFVLHSEQVVLKSIEGQGVIFWR